MENRWWLGFMTFFGLVDTWVKLFTPSPQRQEEILVYMHHQELKVLKTLVLYQASQEQNSWG